MTIRYGKSKKQFVRGVEVENLRIVVTDDAVVVDYDEKNDDVNICGLKGLKL